MAVIQTIKYNSTNSYFTGFLQAVVDESGIVGSVEQDKDTITLKLEYNNEHDNLTEFNEFATKYIPHSIFLDTIETKFDDISITPTNFKSKDYNISPCAKCIEMLNDPSSEYYLDESLKCNHYSNDAKEEYSDNTIFSPHYSEGSTLLVTDANSVGELFIVTEDEIKALFSIEKPTLKVTIQDEILKNITGKKYINIKSPYNTRSILASINAKESGVNYLFFHHECDLDVVVVQKNISIIKASRVASELEELNSDSVVNRFLNIKKEVGFTKATVGSYLSTKGISFIVSNEVDTKKVIEFDDFDYTSVLHSFQHSPQRMKLYQNFLEKYQQSMEKLDASQNPDLWFVISKILEIEGDDFESICDKSYEFHGNGGLKIDMNFSENGFSYDDLIGSLMSFRLAGAETHYIAYSLFEALGDMAITVMNQLKTKFKCEHFIMMGDMFGNSVLYSRILSKFQLSNPYFSKSFALDD
jgi:hypothetical protein